MEVDSSLVGDHDVVVLAEDQDIAGHEDVAFTTHSHPEEPVDERVQATHEEAQATQEGDKIGQTSIVPEVGMTFESENHAYEMYNNYAGKIGFSIRKSTTKLRSDGTLYQKYIVCSAEGQGKNESSKGTTRTGCGARIQLVVSREGIWTVNKVVLEHNHYLASPNKKKILRSQRRVSEADRKLIGQIREADRKIPVPYSPNLPMLKTAAESYTRRMYSEFEAEFKFVEKHGLERENLTTQAARISRKATSIALKCSLSKELLDDLENAIDKLDLDADTSIIKVQEKANEVPPVSAYCSTDTLTGKISFRVPRVVKGPKKKRSTTSLEKRKGKKNRSANKDKGADPKQTMDLDASTVEASTTAVPSFQSCYVNATMPDFNMHMNSSMMDAQGIQGGYTSLLFGVDKDVASAVRKLHFDGVIDNENI